MLYDNALLARLFAQAGRAFQQPDFLAVGNSTLRFLTKELTAPEGGYIAGLSAVDEAGIEGGYYLWSGEELLGLLEPAELCTAQLAWGLSGNPRFDAGFFLPPRVQSSAQTAGATQQSLDVEAQLRSARARLEAARRERHVPQDTQILAACNGLAQGLVATGDQQFWHATLIDIAAGSGAPGVASKP